MTKAEHERVIPRRAPEQVSVPGLGDVKAGSITYGTASQLRQRTLELPAEARAAFYVNELISLFLVEPELTPEQAAELPDAAIEALIPHAAELEGISDLLDHHRDQPPRERLYGAWDDRWRQRERELMALAGSFEKSIVASAQGLAKVVASIETTQNFFASFRRNLEFANELVRPSALEALIPSIQLLESTRLKLPTVPQDFFDRTFRLTALDGPMVHTSRYVPPALAPAPSAEDVRSERRQAAYDMLYRVEDALRQLIVHKLEGFAGSAWWKSRVPDAVQAGCADRKADRERKSRQDLHPVEYAWVDEYRQIVMRRDNWRDCFKAVFGHKEDTETFFRWLAAARVDIGHVRDLTDEDYSRFVLAVNSVIRSIDSTS